MNAYQDSFISATVAHCGICGRTLTDPISVARGIGPICAVTNGQGLDMPAKDTITDERLFIPAKDGIHITRENGTVMTNVPHLVTHHSPTGFEFGYGGSGPADLALNICEWMLQLSGYNGPLTKCFDGHCFEKAYEMHQEFKWEFVASLPKSGAVIPYESVKSWVEARR